MRLISGEPPYELILLFCMRIGLTAVISTMEEDEKEELLEVPDAFSSLYLILLPHFFETDLKIEPTPSPLGAK